MLTKIRESMQTRRAGGESGFTLIELLVVMIIIGILAAIAIPIFQNQQKSARDSAVTSDVRNVATNVQSALVKYPDAAYFEVTSGGTSASPYISDGNTGAIVHGIGGIITIYVGDSYGEHTIINVSVSDNTYIKIGEGPDGPGSFVVKGANASGKSYSDITFATAGSYLQYDSTAGGLQK